MSTPASALNPVLSAAEQAAIPSAIAVLKAFQAFQTNLGTDPLLWPAKLGGAQLIFLGTLQNLAPSLLVSEGAALESVINTTVGGWITKLQAAQTPTP